MLPEYKSDAAYWLIWELKRIQSIMKNLKKSDVLYDIGTEDGDMSALFATKCKIHLFEPAPPPWPIIKQTWEANNLPKPDGYFVGFASNKTNLNPILNDVQGKDKDGWPQCAYEEGEVGHFRHLSQQTDSTPQIKIDDYIQNHGVPTVLNIDAEGSEFEILKGAQGCLITSKPLVFVSVHPEFMYEGFKQFMTELFEYMKALGYKYDLLAVDHELHTVFYHPGGRRYET